MNVRASLLAASALLGCDLQTVELAPHAPAASLVEGAVPPSVLRRFSMSGAGQEDVTRLRFTYPEGSLRQVPLELLPLDFAWDTAPSAPSAPTPPMTPPAPMMPMPKAAGMPKPTSAKAPEFFELCMRAARDSFCLYTTAHQGSAPFVHWATLAESSLSKPLRVTLRALLGDELFAAPALELTFVQTGETGTLYYQTPTQPSVRRAQLSDDSSELVSAIQLDLRARGAVYALARDGRHAVIASSEQELAWLSLPDGAVLWTAKVPVSGTGPVALALDPTARKVACARAGQLALLDADTGTLLDAALAPGVRVGQPDWSPDGRDMVVALWPQGAAPDEQALQGSSLARIPVALDGTLGAPKVLVASAMGDDTLAFPAYAPDGSWIAFERVKGALRDGREASLWLVPAAGGSPIALAFGRADGDQAAQGLQHQPSWLEVEEQVWLLHSSTHAVGNRKLGKDQVQLWLAPLELSRAGLGQDPSDLPFWLPFQSDGESAEHATWAPRAE